MPERESMEVDVLIVGAGPAGLACACQLLKRAETAGQSLNVVVLEKGSEVGAHILSGALFEPRALNELFPDWQDRGAPLDTPVKRDQMLLLRSPAKALSMPLWMLPGPMHNHGNYIISLGALCRWLGAQAEMLGAQIFPGFAAAEVLYDSDGRVRGIATNEQGRGRDGTPKADYSPGMELHAKVTLFAEGSRGHLSKQLIKQFSLDADAEPQHYAIGIKELWEVPKEQHQPGLAMHMAGWPLSDTGASGGGFLYHFGENLVSFGLITDLGYHNPHLSPFEETQRLKLHPKIREHLAGGKRIGYGARAITKGGFAALPRQVMPGALLIGCAAGTLNFSKIKGSHTAMKSGMLAADLVFDHLGGSAKLEDYPARFKASWLYPELRKSRNFGAALHRFGTYLGGAYNYVEQNGLRGRAPWLLRDPVPDHAALKPAHACPQPDYPKPDRVLTFDKTSSVYLANLAHDEDQPVHLRLAEPGRAVAINYTRYAGPEAHFCPAGVYEFVTENDTPALQINAQNCVHCKTCDIKDPTQNITWVAPEGGSGPNYGGM